LKNKENYFIDFLRFIFSLCIISYHSWIFAGTFGNGFFNYGYLAVDFYFIVTGYLMMNSIFKNKNNNKVVLKESFHFIYKKITRLFPSLFVTFIIGIFFVYGKEVFINPRLLLSNQLLPELLQLGIFGYDMTINSSWWYISAMLFALALLYPIALRYKEDYSKYIAPIILVIFLGIVNIFKVNINDPFLIQLFLRNGFYKAVIFIILGNISFMITKKIKEKEFKKIEVMILSIMEVLLYIILIINMNYFYIGTFVFALLLMLNISLTFSSITISTKIFKNPIWKELGNYGFYMYLCNISIRTYLLNKYSTMCLPYKEMFIKLEVTTMIVGLISYIIVELIYKKMIQKSIVNNKNKKSHMIEIGLNT